MKPIEILPVKKAFVKPDNLNPILPSHPFLEIVISPPRGGKSNALINKILNPELYYNGKGENPSYFDEIFWLSPTSKFDFTTKEALKKLDIVHQINDPDELVQSDVLLTEIMKEQADADEDDRKKILIVFDDMVGIIDKLPKLQQLATKFRHFSLSIIIVSQSYRKIPNTIRNCITSIMLFDLKNAKEFEKIYDEIGSGVPLWNELVERSVKKRYDFVYFNVEKQEMYHCYKKLLWSRDMDDPDKKGYFTKPLSQATSS